MAKLIRAYRRASYGLPLVTDKYSPLINIDFTETDASYCDSMLSRRWQVLNILGLMPQPLVLALPSWDDAIAAEQEADQKPPLVVISTNRSEWIKKAIEAGDAQLRKLKITQFDNASDLRALTALSKQKLSPPMYCPTRIGDAGPRSVYIVVHASEYQTYKANLAGTGVTVVGWIFEPPRKGEIPLCGFGASRYAAIEFCKKLRTAADEPWDYAWLFDDNVVAFTSFAGYEKVETAMAAGKKKPPPDTGTEPYICAGFSGGTKTISPKDNANWAKRELDSGEDERGGEYTDLPAVIATGLIQQAALWNIAELSSQNLNFGPIFITSGEDVSIGKYFDTKKIPYLYYEGISIRKEDTQNDGTPGAQVIQAGRDAIAELFAESERIDARPYLDFPPPTMIKPLKRSDDKVVFDETEQTLGRFIVKTVLPNASETIKAQAANKKTRNTAMCQATEQTICKAIELKLVGDPALNQTFKSNAVTPQVVKTVSK